mmetsp:Transcript_26659/g.80351  ORF Transcript_26659/g.80351 Transcript_26659/m.80351 type:complete len:254 (+) Transcript_26659:183-944(+)
MVRLRARRALPRGPALVLPGHRRGLRQVHGRDHGDHGDYPSEVGAAPPGHAPEGASPCVERDHCQLNADGFGLFRARNLIEHHRGVQRRLLRRRAGPLDHRRQRGVQPLHDHVRVRLGAAGRGDEADRAARCVRGHGHVLAVRLLVVGGHAASHHSGFDRAMGGGGDLRHVPGDARCRLRCRQGLCAQMAPGGGAERRGRGPGDRPPAAGGPPPRVAGDRRGRDVGAADRAAACAGAGDRQFAHHHPGGAHGG